MGESTRDGSVEPGSLFNSCGVVGHAILSRGLGAEPEAVFAGSEHGTRARVYEDGRFGRS